MDFMQLVKKRKSTRKYQDRPVEKEKIMQCLEAARLAPSAQNSQPWSFIVIQDREQIRRFSKKVFSGIYLPSAFAGNAGAIVAVLAKPSFMANVIGEQIQDVLFYMLDIGIGGEHLVLQAEELGIGTCWLGWFNMKETRKYLDIPASYKIMALVAMGYPADHGAVKEKNRRPIEDLIMKWI